MKITGFTPLIVTTKGSDVQKVFEELGFEQRHRKVSGVSEDIFTVDMKDAGGNRVDISNVQQLPRDMMIIRMNVDDLDEAVGILKAHGFNPVENSASTTSSSEAILMASPSGFAIDVVKHIKD